MKLTHDGAELRAWLSRWAARRALARRTLGLATILAAALAAALAVFAFDWLLRAGLAARAVLLVAWLALVAGVAVRSFGGGRRWRDSPLDLALVVERRRKLEGDLVAALQFAEELSREPPRESARTAAGPSRQLRLAVVGYVAEYAKSLPPEPAQWSARAATGVVALAAIAAVWAGLFVRSPDAITAFGRRLLLGEARYPTQTRIEEIHVNEHAYAPGRAIKAAAGEPLTIAVHGLGDIPPEGQIVVRDDAGRSLTLPLKRTAADEPDAAYVATLPALIDSCRCDVYLGDAWTEEIRVQVAERPRAMLTIWVKPPEYAAGKPLPEPSAFQVGIAHPPVADLVRTQPAAAVEGDNSHEFPYTKWSASPGGAAHPVFAASAAAEIAALAGSRIEVEVACDNKPLAAAALLHDGQEFDLVQAGSRRRWKLAAAPRALQTVARDAAFTVRVIDVDGLSTPDAFSCVVRAVGDRPPTARAEALTTVIVPGARPTIAYHVADDVALAKVLMERAIMRAGETRQLEPIEIEVNGRPATIEGRVQLDTSELSLHPGDELRATFAAVDFRGEEAGRRAVSDVVRFRVADEAGALAALAADGEQPILREPADRAPAEDLP